MVGIFSLRYLGVGMETNCARGGHFISKRGACIFEDHSNLLNLSVQITTYRNETSSPKPLTTATFTVHIQRSRGVILGE